MTVVVLGAGHGGVQVAASLRSEGHRGPVILLDAQEHLPHHRPQLSKEYLGPGAGQPQLLRSASFFADQDIDLRLGTAAVALHPTRRQVELHDDGTLAYTHLVLALGSTLRRLRVPGVHLDGVTQAATLADAAALRERLSTARDVVVVGGAPRSSPRRPWPAPHHCTRPDKSSTRCWAGPDPTCILPAPVSGLST